MGRKKKTKTKLDELPPDIKRIVEQATRDVLERVLTQIYAATGKIKVRIEEQEKSTKELERILMDLINVDPQELGEYLDNEEYLNTLASAIYFTKKAATSKPENITSKLIMYYFRTIDAIAATLIHMIQNAREMVLERTIQIKQAAIVREDPVKELDRLETILTLLDGLKKHIKNIIDEADT